MSDQPAEAAPKRIGGDSSSILKPKLAEDQVRRLLLSHFDLEVETMKEFPSYDDLNFYVRAHHRLQHGSHGSHRPQGRTGMEQEAQEKGAVGEESGGSKEYVLKINNYEEDRLALDLQNKAMMHLRAMGFPAPLVLRSVRDETMFEIHTETLALLPPTTGAPAPASAAFPVRLLGFVPGSLLCDIKTTLDHYYAIGKFIAEVDTAFEAFDHPAADRDFTWDMKNAGVFRKHLDLVRVPERKAIAQAVLDTYDAVLLPLMQVEPNRAAHHPAFDGLRVAIIHGDINDHNILVAQSPPAVTGIIDFGDVVRSRLVFDVSVAAAYCVLDQSDPVAVAGAVLRGFLSVKPLNATELSVYPLLVCTRLTMSVLMSARKQTLYPNDAYLRVTERPAWAFLTAVWPKGLDAFGRGIFAAAGVPSP